MGPLSNPLVAAYAAKHGMRSTAPEGYALEVNAGAAVVAGTDDAGAFYGLQSLRQLIARHSTIRGARIRDWPLKPFRGIKLYLPGRENIAYFKRFVRDFMALYKYNTAIVELNAAMRFDRHPELNAGWIEFGKDLNYTRRERSWGPGRQFQDSANADTADFGVLEKEEVADLVRYARAASCGGHPGGPFAHPQLLPAHAPPRAGRGAGRRMAGHLLPLRAQSLPAAVRRARRVHRGDAAAHGARGA